MFHDGPCANVNIQVVLLYRDRPNVGLVGQKKSCVRFSNMRMSYHAQEGQKIARDCGRPINFAACNVAHVVVETEMSVFRRTVTAFLNFTCNECMHTSNLYEPEGVYSTPWAEVEFSRQ